MIDFPPLKAVAPRNDTHIIVTEYGRADLKGKTIHQRAEALVGLAHPKFRDELQDSLG
ncbi:acetyl-CoA hydrolase/transferase C-terminal domain-containing protein [Parasphingorhabdus halotolerans]|uniref:Acetyl-CoA hydrolase/transferase C-terminal domain-containing protein n=1 Tax=Parasphingorhabdus halotolerans TaxID=2725558 RepID=A0A6H2DSC8_9SPHN|nr:acetyl-CoA hydrolase/transferase C-terminal domain-containing protein [Parasphingorhabdus halotolerans]QJB70865.1 hypothetical protein HF685_13955 [Parasphingorhabdus halotolerans]